MNFCFSQFVHVPFKHKSSILKIKLIRCCSGVFRDDSGTANEGEERSRSVCTLCCFKNKSVDSSWHWIAANISFRWFDNNCEMILISLTKSSSILKLDLSRATVRCLFRIYVHVQLCTRANMWTAMYCLAFLLLQYWWTFWMPLFDFIEIEKHNSDDVFFS